MDSESINGGYYTVNLDIAGRKVPYIVFAKSEFHAARKVKQETGYLAHDGDVEGPFMTAPPPTSGIPDTL